MVTQTTNMSLSSQRESLARIHARYQRVGRAFKSRIFDEFCLHCTTLVAASVGNTYQCLFKATHTTTSTSQETTTVRSPVTTTTTDTQTK